FPFANKLSRVLGVGFPGRMAARAVDELPLRWSVIGAGADANSDRAATTAPRAGRVEFASAKGVDCVGEAFLRLRRESHRFSPSWTHQHLAARRSWWRC